MFNVSLKTHNTELQYICDLMEMRHEIYQEYLVKYCNDAVIKWNNFNDFRLKVANVLHKKNHLKSNKKYSFSFNVNCWLSFREFIVWLSIKENIDSDPYFTALYYGYREQISDQLTMRSFSIPAYKMDQNKLN